MLEAMTSERADNVQHVDTLVQRLQQFDDSAQVRVRPQHACATTVCVYGQSVRLSADSVRAVYTREICGHDVMT